MLVIVSHIHLCGDNKKTSTLIAPYRENYVHRILFFYVRISLTSNDQGPAGPDPAGGPARPVQLYKPHVCTRPLLYFGLNSGIPVIAARAISYLVRFTSTAMFVGMSTMRQTIYIPKKLPS